MGVNVGTVLTAEEFIEKYGQNNLDLDPTTPGFQNDGITIADIKADFENLNTSDKYVVFETYRQNGNAVLLTELLGLDQNNYPKTDAGLFKSIEDICNKIHVGAADDATDEDVWETRLLLAQGLFTIDKMVSATQSDGRSFKEMKKLRDEVYQMTSQLYLLTSDPNTKKNKYFNTDGGIIMEASLRQFMFDDMDVDSSDTEKNVDADGDSVADSIDTDPNNKNEWVKVEDGKTYSSSKCDVTKTESGYLIKLKVHLKASDTCNDKDTVAKMLADPEFRKKLADDIHSYYLKNRDADCADIDFQVEFVGDGEICHHEIDFSDSSSRSDSGTWRADALNSPLTMTHELMHSLGLPDNYHEAIVHEGIRDRMTTPGTVLVDPDNIMLCKDHIRRYQLRGIIAEAVNAKNAVDLQELQTFRDKYSDPKNNPVLHTHILWAMSGNPEYKLDIDELKELSAEVKTLLEKDPNDTGLILCAARLEFMLGNNEKANTYIKQAMKNPATKDEVFYLFSIPGMEEKFIEFNKPLAFSDPYMASTYAEKLLEFKKYKEYCTFVDAANNKFPNNDELKIHTLIAKAERTSLNEVFPKLRHLCSEQNKYQAMFVTDYLLDKGAIKEAGMIATSKLSESSFAMSLFNKGYYDEAINLLIKLVKNDPLNTDSITLLIDCYRKKGDYENAEIQLENLFAAFRILEKDSHLDIAVDKKKALKHLELTKEECEKMRQIAMKAPRRSITVKYGSPEYFAHKECLLYLTNLHNEPIDIG